MSEGENLHRKLFTDRMIHEKVKVKGGYKIFVRVAIRRGNMKKSVCQKLDKHIAHF